MRSALLVVAFAACKLTDTLVTLPGDPVVQVQAVLDPTRGVQTVLVGRSQTGALTTAVSGATVTLTDLDPRGCIAPAVQLVETPGGLYRTTGFCPLAPGDRVALRVATPDGAIVTGTTRIPGIHAITVQAGATSALFPPAQLIMDRTRDSVRLSVEPSLTHAIQIEAVRTTTGENATLRFVSDTPYAGIPGDLIDPFDERTIFRAGCYYALTVAALDTNYFDFTRSITNPLTGQGFINHLTGGVGVFGSVAPLTYELRVTAPQTDPREGMYRLTGVVAGSTLDVTWDVYRDALSTTRIRAFVDGSWGGQPVRTSANGSFTDEVFRGTMFSVPSGGSSVRYTLVGTRASAGAPFAVAVRSGATGIVDAVTAVQVSGPGI